ncbi:MAG: hypothetical protein HQ567_10280 [Candidatus Nealsonbacteria bacterium]|nr:hypothetical protein [Candidatus Nealsonbacteria bacterium]
MSSTDRLLRAAVSRKISRRLSADIVAALSMRILLIGSDSLYDLEYPVRRVLGIAKQRLAVRRVEAIPQLADDRFIDAILTQMSQRLNYQGAGAGFRKQFLWADPLEGNSLLAYLIHSRRSIAQVNDFGGNLSGKAQNVGGPSPGGFDPHTILAGDCLGYRIVIRTEFPAEIRVHLGGIVDASGYPADFPAFGQGGQSVVDRGPAAYVEKVLARKGMASPIASNSRKYYV